MLPDLRGKRIVDLGCGFGWASRWMRSQGAVSVLGLDLSQNMITRAKADTSDPAVEYRIADLEMLELPEVAFDVVYSALTFHYIEDFRRLARIIHQALVAGGHLVFTIEHPIFTPAARPHWIADEDGRKDLAGQWLFGRGRTPYGLVCQGRPEASPNARHDAQHSD
jgi:SAM-dependent methyltransferase